MNLEEHIKFLKIKQELEKDLVKRECEDNLHNYIKHAWEIIEPATEFKSNWHIEYIAEHLELVEEGHIKRLLINMPPRNTKSIVATVMYPTWSWIKSSHKKFISLSYSNALSKKHNMNRRDIILSPWYQNNWGDRFSIKDDKNTQTVFENNKQGFMFSTSITGALTGEGSNVIIIDDPHNPQGAESDAERETAVTFFKQTLPSRLNDKKKGAIIVIMQRLHEQDVSGHILAKDSGYVHLNLPAIAEKKTIIYFPKSDQVIVREEGDILNPKREDKAELDQLKRDMGSYAFAGQYQQNPTPSEGGTFKKHWWKFWQYPGQNLPPISVKVPYKGKDGTEKYKDDLIYPVDLPTPEQQFQSWDLAFKDTKGSDFVASGIWNKVQANHYLIDLLEMRLSFTETLAHFRKMTNKYPHTTRKLVEDKANGPAVINMLKNEIAGIIAYNPGSDSKLSRAEAVTHIVESGNVYLPHPNIASWTNDFIDRCAKFPKVTNDDIIDQMSQYLNYTSGKKRKLTW